MIKMVATTPQGRRIILLGLEEMNIVRLREDRTIIVKAEEIGMAGFEIAIILRQDMAALEKELSEFIGPDTFITDDREKS